MSVCLSVCLSDYFSEGKLKEGTDTVQIIIRRDFALLSCVVEFDYIWSRYMYILLVKGHVGFSIKVSCEREIGHLK